MKDLHPNIYKLSKLNNKTTQFLKYSKRFEETLDQRKYVDRR